MVKLIGLSIIACLVAAVPADALSCYGGPQLLSSNSVAGQKSRFMITSQIHKSADLLAGLKVVGGTIVENEFFENGLVILVKADSKAKEIDVRFEKTSLGKFKRGKVATSKQPKNAVLRQDFHKIWPGQTVADEQLELDKDFDGYVKLEIGGKKYVLFGRTIILGTVDCSATTPLTAGRPLVATLLFFDGTSRKLGTFRINKKISMPQRLRKPADKRMESKID